MFLFINKNFFRKEFLKKLKNNIGKKIFLANLRLRGI